MRRIRFYYAELSEVHNIAACAFIAGVMLCIAVAGYIIGQTGDHSWYVMATLGSVGCVGSTWCVWATKRRIISENIFEPDEEEPT